jgi:hypothetical protein
MTMRSLIFVAALGAIAGQTPLDRNAPINPREIVFDHDGRNITSFVAYFHRENDPDGTVRVVLIPNRVPRDAHGTFHLNLEGLPDGIYNVEIAAINRAGESPRVPTEPRQFVVSKGRRGAIRADLGAPQTGLFKRLWTTVIGADSDEPPKKP